MSRQLYLPELLSIHLKNYSLYPNGLDYTFDFVKGINLVLGGNGMGKTTFVNIIKYAIIGNYKKQMDYTRMYKEKMIEKRTQLPPAFFSNRMKADVAVEGEPTVTIRFRLNSTELEIERGLRYITILSLKVDGNIVEGDIIDQYKYEKLNDDQKENFLLYRFEKIVERCSNLKFDDLIFFVNEILFFGEDHKTILWDDDSSRQDVQTELFNKYFNSPELDEQRQKADRQAKYFDSLSRHKSEDMRAINNVLKRNKNEETIKEDSAFQLIELSQRIEENSRQIEELQTRRTSVSHQINVLRNEINKAGTEVYELEKEKARLETQRNSQMWESIHPRYHAYERNILVNHICPMCNHEDEKLAMRVSANPGSCFVCERHIDSHQNDNLNAEYRNIVELTRQKHNLIANKKKNVELLEKELATFDMQFAKLDTERRFLAEQKRQLEYLSTKKGKSSDIEPFLLEIQRLSDEKEKYQRLSEDERVKVKKFSKQIEDEIKTNVLRFSAIFASYAEKFLGVKCELTYIKGDSDLVPRFYPVIDGITRYYEEELSESQRFFIDHSFRMTILSFFYNTPTFYIVETPDSSLDISYEHNAANVFMKFLESPNSVIITSNLNNSSFVNYLVQTKSTEVALVGLPDIAQQSVIQNSSDQIVEIYNNIKKALQ